MANDRYLHLFNCFKRYIWGILKTMGKLFLMMCTLLFTTVCLAQKPVDSVSSPLKAMSYEQYKAYTNGVDINKLDAVAELNHYPSPQKALSFKKELGLNADQVAELTAMNTELKRKMKEMGAFIIKNETTLDNLFRTRQLTDGSLIFYANRYGLYIGELRNAMLQTYLKTQNILTAEQLKKYGQLHKP